MFPLWQTRSCTCPSPVPLSFPLQQQPVLDSFDTLHFRRQQHSCIMWKGTVRVGLLTCVALATLEKYTVLKSVLQTVVFYQQFNTHSFLGLNSVMWQRGWGAVLMLMVSRHLGFMGVWGQSGWNKAWNLDICLLCLLWCWELWHVKY